MSHHLIDHPRAGTQSAHTITKKRPVIAIGLDAADPRLIETWMAQGHLKNLRRLRDEGAYARLKSFDYYRAETPWTTFLTGCSPQKTGFWTQLRFRANDYSVEDSQAYRFEEYPPFYALGNDYRVAVFDMPQARLSDQVNGIQVLAWGAHSPQSLSHSRPSALFDEIVEQYGQHPTLRDDNANVLDVPALKQLQHDLETGIARRAAICQDLLEREQWNLFLTIFGEIHGAGHYMWHMSQPDHPLYSVMHTQAEDMLLAIFEATDKAIGQIIAKAPKDAEIVVFAAHGMGSNTMDLPSMFFLPEFLYRYNFPGKYAMARGNTGEPLGEPITSGRVKRCWLGALWSLKYEPNPIAAFLRRNLKLKLFNLIAPLLGRRPQPDLISPFDLVETSHSFYFQPAVWYKPFWPTMKAFALPSYSEGYIRINLKGREPQGIVDPADYDTVCDDICEKLYQLKDARTGIPMVKQIIRPRRDLPNCEPSKLPDADIVVIWQEETASDAVESPDIGRIGPVPHHRSGSHRAEGFLVVKGADIDAGSTLPEGHSLDLAPTLLSLMGAPIPDHLEGKPMINVSTPAS
ncbi:alkaline phosphatase family protein [Oculatella sp. LEGE 06141]|uniref:alkaline phosphatase family protein n=1 Tax=Oculatella sp. LEGE 06141 TaxID=1828648 RepID=UPI00187F36F9|nr:alkaline phosphatase family protein [Oculatella sp. LEGE 06141]MBE9181754.1 alkaline phosphatase family protein [Oculatella sp. LEGE 06141]